ncbi:hypothetical protein [Acidiphilium acidophilum]|uniref:hypothetical protein n=1 Tax=Acidiphilium acidophilum TaxID=76588 RepID=UPI002E8E68CF|nr:hypothetical protein [Acidiphilium acidophilum]
MSSNAPSHPLTHADVIGRIIEILEGLLAVLAAQYPDGNLTTGVLRLTCRHLAAYRASNDNPIPPALAAPTPVRSGAPTRRSTRAPRHRAASLAHPATTRATSPHARPDHLSPPPPPPRRSKTLQPAASRHAHIVTISQHIDPSNPTRLDRHAPTLAYTSHGKTDRPANYPPGPALRAGSSNSPSLPAGA